MRNSLNTSTCEDADNIANTDEYMKFKTILCIIAFAANRIHYFIKAYSKRV